MLATPSRWTSNKKQLPFKFQSLKNHSNFCLRYNFTVQFITSFAAIHFPCIITPSHLTKLIDARRRPRASKRNDTRGTRADRLPAVRCSPILFFFPSISSILPGELSWRHLHQPVDDHPRSPIFPSVPLETLSIYCTPKRVFPYEDGEPRAQVHRLFSILASLKLAPFRRRTGPGRVAEKQNGRGRRTERGFHRITVMLTTRDGILMDRGRGSLQRNCLTGIPRLWLDTYTKSNEPERSV
ncbi:unnamed protein product [Xylocopa violacea]|uniref:Uncharacterized protein n=1 Tax=Xylocopa violacea TaxID=135666 RepID=A0ABP1N662_XYLVO